MNTNKLGFVIIRSGVVEVFSNHSALSGDPLGSGAMTAPVPGEPGLCFRVSAGEARQLTDEQRADIHQRAMAWYAARQPVNVRLVNVEPVRKHREPPIVEKGE